MNPKIAQSSQKETIYIDIDDEITTIIDKVRGSNEKILALVLPKRATVLQSIVNMKLLKRAAEQEKKSLVLITAEVGLLPLAGTVGLYVAKTLQTKPEIPAVPGQEDDSETIDELSDDTAEEVTAATAGARPIGELAGKVGVPAAADEAIETLALDDENSDEPEASDPKATDGKKPQKPKNKKLGVPNFERFRLLLILGVVLIFVLGIGGYVAAQVLPKASVTITTDTSSVDSNLNLTADTGVKTLNAAKATLPAQVQKVQKTGSQQVPATGKINNGQKATGSITVSVQCTKKPQSSDAGIGVTSGGLTFITTDKLTFTSIDVDSGGNFICSGVVPIKAQQGGAQYNLPANSTFSVYGGMTATNANALTGGTDNIIQVVAQSDIDSATQKIAAQDTNAIKQQLTQQLQQAGEYAIAATFNAGAPANSNSANVGDQVSTVTVTQNITYTMFGIKQADLKTLVDNDIKDKIDPSKQTILDEGLAKASFKINSASDTNVQFALSTTATAGPDLKVADVKKAIAGKKSGQIITMLKADPGVSDVKVHLSPFWVTSAPSKANKVTVTFQKQ